MFPVWPCSVWGLPDDPLPNRRCALTAPFHPYLRPFGPSAVYFLLHFPSLTGPRVTRHTALWSSDFPLWAKAQSDHPSACERTGYCKWPYRTGDSRSDRDHRAIPKLRAGLLPDALQQTAQVRRQWRLNRHHCSGARMSELQLCGMEEVSSGLAVLPDELQHIARSP